MKILEDRNCKYFLRYETDGEYKENLKNSLISTEKYSIKAVSIHQVRTDDLVEYIYEQIEPSTNLNDPFTRETFCNLTLDQQKQVATKIIIYRYCIHRLLVLNKLYEPEHWMYKTINDYYGEEVDVICLKPEIAKTVDLQINILMTLDNSKKIEYVLELEYGHLIPSVIDREWSILQVDFDQMVFSNQKLLERCLEEDQSYLETYKLPRAIATKQADGRYKVIDGYSRVANAKDNKFLIIYC